jgi:hypothetical protein
VSLHGDHLIVLMVAVTSLGAVAVGVHLLCLPARALPRAGAAVLDVLGLAVVFFVANAALAILVLLAERHLGGRLVSVSLHTTDDLALYVTSLLQAIAFQAWRATRPPGGQSGQTIARTSVPDGRGEGDGPRRPP